MGYGGGVSVPGYTDFDDRTTVSERTLTYYERRYRSYH